MTGPSVGVAGNLADDPEVRSTEAGIARARFRVAVSGRPEHEASFFTVIGGRDPAEHVAEWLGKGSRVVVAEELGRACDGRPPPHPDHRQRQRLDWVRHPVRGA
jgi:Single-strand binding protein family